MPSGTPEPLLRRRKMSRTPLENVVKSVPPRQFALEEMAIVMQYCGRGTHSAPQKLAGVTLQWV